MKRVVINGVNHDFPDKFVGVGNPDATAYRGAHAWRSKASQVADRLLAKLAFSTGNYEVDQAVYAAVANIPGYAFTRSGQMLALDADGSVDSFAANAVPINGNGLHAFGALTTFATATLTPENWTATGWTKTANNALAPDGTMKACLFTPPAGTSSKVLQSYAVNAHNGAVKTFSIFIKKGGHRYFQISCDVMPAFNFDIVGNVSKRVGGAGGASYIVDCGGWVRLVVVYPNTNHGGNVYICPADNYNHPQYGNTSVTATFHAWGWSHINGEHRLGGPLINHPNSGYGVSIGANFLQTNIVPPASDFICYASLKSLSLDAMKAVFDISALTTASHAALQINAAGSLHTEIYGDSGIQTAAPAITPLVGGDAVVMLRRRSGKISVAHRQGATVTIGAESASAVNFHSTANKIAIGSDRNGSSNVNCRMPEFILRQGTFSDAQITSILEGVA